MTCSTTTRRRCFASAYDHKHSGMRMNESAPSSVVRVYS